MELEDIKVGDTIIISTLSKEFLEKVCRVTKTLVITNHYRFKKDGHLCGNGAYTTIRARKGSEEDIIKIEMSEKRDKLYRSIKNILQSRYPSLKDCEDVYSILKKYI